MIVAVAKETFPGENRVALVPAVGSGPDKGRARGGRRAQAGRSGRISRRGLLGQRRQDRRLARRGLCRRRRPPGPRGRGQPRRPPRTMSRDEGRPGRDRACDPLGSPQAAQDVAAKRRHAVRPGTGAADHPGPEHGRALVDGHGRRLSGRAAGGRDAAQDVSHDDDRRRHDHAGQGVRRRGRRGRPAGDRHGQAAGRRRLGLRRPAGREGAGARAWGEVRRAGAGHGRGRGQGRLRQGDGRGVLPKAARDDRPAWWPRATW